MNRYLKIIILVFGFALGIMGCKQDASTSIEPVQTSLLTYQPKGTITGLVMDRVTYAPVAGAVISVGYDGEVKSTASDGAGAFSFANVPAGQYQIVNGTRVFSGRYNLTVSLVAYNSGQANPDNRYRDYYYSTDTITFTSLAPGDSLAVSDMVGSVLLQISHRNTTVAGQVVDQNMQPVANANVMLYDLTVNQIQNTVIGQTTTTATGMYQFTHVDNAIRINITAQSADGLLRGSLPTSYLLPANVDSNYLRPQVTLERIQLSPLLADDVPPLVTNISPEYNADVSFANLQIIYTFSEPIKQNAYTRTDLPVGHSTIVDDIVLTYIGLKKSAATVPFTVQWNSTTSPTQLIITPSSAQVFGSAKYSVDLRTVLGKLTDLAGNHFIDNPRIQGDLDAALLFTTNGNSGTPAAPQVKQRTNPALFPAVDYNGGSIGLEWNADNSVRSYNIYKSINGGSYDLLQKDFYGLQFTDNTGSLVIPLGASNPLKAGNVSYMVRAVSKDLRESDPSNIITIGDGKTPRLTNATVASAGSTNNWIYTLSFSEPLKLSPAETIGNYSIPTFGGIVFTIGSADYLGFLGGVYRVQLGVATTGALPVGYTLFVGNGVMDLAGWSIDASANTKTF